MKKNIRRDPRPGYATTWRPGLVTVDCPDGTSKSYPGDEPLVRAILELWPAIRRGIPHAASSAATGKAQKDRARRLPEIERLRGLGLQDKQIVAEMRISPRTLSRYNRELRERDRKAARPAKP
jgi:hypothetical protein